MNEILNELKSRHEKTRELIKQAGIDAILVLQDIDLLYYTNSMQALAIYIPVNGNVIAFYKSALERIKQDCPLELVQTKSIKLIPGLIKELSGELPEKIGFEFDVLPVAVFNRIVKSFNNEKTIIPVDCGTLVKKVRMIKSDYELSLMRKSGSITKKVFEQTKSILKPGISELDAAIEIEYLYRKYSHLGPTRMRTFNHELFYGHVLSGETALIPASFATPFGGKGSHASFSSGPSDSIIKKNEPIAIDYVANYNGYHVDTTRTFVIGKLDKFLQTKYNGLLEIHNEIKSLLKPGAICSDIYKHILNFVDKLGLSKNFMGLENEQVSFIGHGIGVEVDEYPVIAKGFDFPIEKNMTIAFEPKLFFQGHGALGIEDTFLITDDVPEVLSDVDIEIIEV